MGGTDFFNNYGYLLHVGASGKPFLLHCSPGVNHDRSLTSQMFPKLFRAIPFEILGGKNIKKKRFLSSFGRKRLKRHRIHIRYWTFM